MEKKKSSGERKRKIRSSETAEESKAKKKRKSVLWEENFKNSEKMGNTEEHSRMLGMVTGRMKELPLEENAECPGMTSSTTKKKNKKQSISGSGAQKEKMNGVEDGSKSSVDKDSASEYLLLWVEDRDKWSFKKKTQYWLLQNMYYKDKLSKSTFSIMLQYLVGLQGNQRILVLSRARDLMKENEPIKDETPGAKWVYKRAKKVTLILSH